MELSRSKDRVVRADACDGDRGYLIEEKVRIETGRNKWRDSRVYLSNEEIKKLLVERGSTPEGTKS